MMKYILYVILALLLVPFGVSAAYDLNVSNITATEQSTPAGTNVTYVINLTNNGSSGGDSYYVNITNIDSASIASINITSPVYIEQDAIQYIALNVTNTSSGSFHVNVTAMSVNDTTKNTSINTTTTVTAVRAINFTNISATSASTLAGTNHSYTLIVTNNGSDTDSYDIAISNINTATTASLNVTSITLTAGASEYILLNVTNTTAGTSYLVNVTLTSLYNSLVNSSVNTTTSVYSVPTITTYSPGTPVTDQNAVISRTFSVTVDQSATVVYYLNGVNVGSAVGTTVTYTNSTPALGTWNVTATATTLAGADSQTWSWIVPSSTISNATVVTGTGASDRIINNSNTSINFSFHDSGNISFINLTFPATFNFTALLAANVSTGIGTCTLTLTSTLISCYNATGLNNTATYINLTVNVTTPPSSGTNNILITTNKNTTGVTVPLYVRDSTKPFYVKSNNSNFVIASETFGTMTTTISLTGSGVSNLTFYAPNVTGQTNITVGYGATNVSTITTTHTLGTSPNNTIYIVTDGTITNPIITISNVSGMQSSNLPYVVVTGGLIVMAAGYYVLRRRRH